MSAVVAESTCTCTNWVGTAEVRQCPEHFHIWKGAKRLASVGSIIRSCWPQPDRLPPDDVLENARIRGEATDKLFGAYCLGKLSKIPAGTRLDVKDLLLKLIRWYDAQHFKSVQVQVLLGGDDHGGVMDFRFDGMAVDLKCTYDVADTHLMQVAAYHALDSQSTAFSGAAILHVTERVKDAKLIPLQQDDYDDWRTLLAHWRMVQRRLTTMANKK